MDDNKALRFLCSRLWHTLSGPSVDTDHNDYGIAKTEVGRVFFIMNGDGVYQDTRCSHCQPTFEM